MEFWSVIKYKPKEGCEDEFIESLKGAVRSTEHCVSWTVTSLDNGQFMEAVIFLFPITKYLMLVVLLYVLISTLLLLMLMLKELRLENKLYFQNGMQKTKLDMACLLILMENYALE